MVSHAVSFDHQRQRQPELQASSQHLRHHALTRRPASVAASSTQSLSHRHHRSNWSYTGTPASCCQQDHFPVFENSGDLEITLRADGQERRYLLHRLILCQASKVFEASTSHEWDRSVAPVASDSLATNDSALSRLDENDQHAFAPKNEGVEGSLQALPPPRTGATQPVNASSSAHSKIRWRYELDWGEQQSDEIPMLVQKPVQSSSLVGASNTEGTSAEIVPPPPPPSTKPARTSYQILQDITNTAQSINSDSSKPSQKHTSNIRRTSIDILLHYDNLLRIIYNHPPNLDCSSIADAYVQCKLLLRLADMYDSLHVVAPRVDHHILRFQGRLWKQVAKYPPSYLKLGYLAQSRLIFAEALVHVVGTWPMGSSQIRHALPDSVLALIEDKVDELSERRALVDKRLFCISLSTAKGDPVGPATAYADWLALSFFRQWLVDHIDHAPGIFYREIAASGQAYLGHHECKRFFRLRPDDPGSRDALRRFEGRVAEIKEIAKELVQPLVKSYLELDTLRDSGKAVEYLTCTKMDEEDLPWT